MSIEIYTGKDASWHAKKKARYGHKDWVVWLGKDGQQHTARKTAESVKAAMLANGTQGKFVMYYGDGTSALWGWWMGCNYLKAVRLGYAWMYD